jgi:hypothetical protein
MDGCAVEGFVFIGHASVSHILVRLGLEGAHGKACVRPAKRI